MTVTTRPTTLRRASDDRRRLPPLRFSQGLRLGFDGPRGARIASNRQCALCDESLAANLAGETAVELVCLHLCHIVCLHVVLDADDVLAKCSICGQQARCADKELHTTLLQLDILEELDDVGTDQFLHLRLDEDPAETPSSIFEVGSHQDAQLLLPGSSDAYLTKVYDDLLRPRVALVAAEDAVELAEEPVHDVLCLLSIRPPEIYSCPQPSEAENDAQRAVVAAVTALLAGVLNWDNSIGLGALGGLLMVDNLNISVNGTDWDQVLVYFFEHALLMVETKLSSLVGQVVIGRDVSNMNLFGSTIILNLINDAVPELHLNTLNAIVFVKWSHFLTKALKQLPVEVPLFQFSTNAWSIVDAKLALPDDIWRFSNLIDRGVEVPSSLLVKAVPPPDASSLNLVLSMLLINNSSLADETYRERIVSMIKAIKSTLRPFDKLGLIFVGTDGSGKACNTGSFVGCVEANWDGWNSIIDSIEIFSNRNEKFQPILNNGFEEMLVSFQKYIELSPFIPAGPKNNNKFLLLNSNEYESFTHKDEDEVSRELKALLDNLKGTANFSIDVVRLGQAYNSEVERLQRMISTSVYMSATKTVRESYGNNLYRFDSFEPFIRMVPSLIAKYQSIYVSNFSIKLETGGVFAQFQQLEIDGKLSSIDAYPDSNLLVNIQNLYHDSERNVLFKVTVDTSKIDSKVLEKGIHVVNFEAQSSDGHKEKEKLAIKFSRAARTSVLDGNGILTPPETGKEPFSIDLPLHYSAKQQSFGRRQVELIAISSLRASMSDDLSTQQRKDMLFDAILQVFQISRGVDSPPILENSITQREKTNSYLAIWVEPESYKKLYHYSDYAQFIVGELQAIIAMWDNNVDQALVKSQDLAHWLN